jgi:hypothetical protein
MFREWPKGQTIMSKRKMRRFQFEQLEKRQLLAADFAVGVIQCETMPAEQCEIAATDLVDSGLEIDFEETELPGSEPIDSIETALEGGDGIAGDLVGESAATVTDAAGVGIGLTVDEELVEVTETAHRLSDPVLGTGG